MRLTLHADYSLRVLMYAGLKKNELVTISEIPECFDISKNHLMKVVYQLEQLGYIETVQGKNGGFRLLRKPDKINIAAVIRDTEQELDVVRCVQQAAIVVSSRRAYFGGHCRERRTPFWRDLRHHFAG